MSMMAVSAVVLAVMMIGAGLRPAGIALASITFLVRPA
jgi:hypothetical protein